MSLIYVHKPHAFRNLQRAIQEDEERPVRVSCGHTAPSITTPNRKVCIVVDVGANVFQHTCDTWEEAASKVYEKTSRFLPHGGGMRVAGAFNEVITKAAAWDQLARALDGVRPCAVSRWTLFFPRVDDDMAHVTLANSSRWYTFVGPTMRDVWGGVAQTFSAEPTRLGARWRPDGVGAVMCACNRILDLEDVPDSYW